MKETASENLRATSGAPAGCRTTSGANFRRPAPPPPLPAGTAPVAVACDRARYFGSKGGAGVFQTLINEMPPHRVYIEAFLGSGTLMRMKRPADRNIGLDLDIAALDLARLHTPTAELACVDAIAWLENFTWRGGELVYADPPYLLATRASQQPRYRFELTHHVRLLRVLKRLPCNVMISGYWSELYAEELKSWRVISYRTRTHRATVQEFCWLNFPPPMELHDYTYLGKNWRERQNVRKMQKRWIKRLANMPTLQRFALLSAIREGLSHTMGPRADLGAARENQ